MGDRLKICPGVASREVDDQPPSLRGAGGALESLPVSFDFAGLARPGSPKSCQIGLPKSGRIGTINSERQLEQSPPTRVSSMAGVQGYLAHQKTPTPLGPPEDPRHRPTIEY